VSQDEKQWWAAQTKQEYRPKRTAERRRTASVNAERDRRRDQFKSASEAHWWTARIDDVDKQKPGGSAQQQKRDAGRSCWK
jgi:hypothetical protein